MSGDAPVLEPVPEGPLDREGFQNRLGLVVTHRGPGAIRAKLEVTPFHLNRSGIVHGGVYATILDAALNASGTYCPHPGRIRRAVTLSLTTNYTGRCRGGTIRIEARHVAGRRTYTATGEAIAEDGTVLAHATGTFRCWPGSETEHGEDLEAVKAASLARD